MTLRKAMLFAAGRGERLKPLTDKIPKPLLPIGDRPMIDYSLAYLKRYGIEEVVINLWHLGEKIERYVGDGKRFGLKVIYSKEKELLGTGGGLKNAQEHFKNEKAFITLNSDTLIDCDLTELAAFHQKEKTQTTLVVAPWQEGYTKIKENYLFTGLAVWNPSIFENLPLNTLNLITYAHTYIRTSAHFLHKGLWLDIGTMEKYKAAQEEWAASHCKRVS